MATLKEDIQAGSMRVSEGLKSFGYKLDFSLESLKEIDRFFTENSKDGKPIPNAALSKKLGAWLFAIGAYVGEVIKKKVGGEWITNDSDPAGEINIILKLTNGSQIWPVQKVIKRFRNGYEDSIYVYGYAITTKDGDGIEFKI